ncbi:30S ribosomal protein S2 [Salaquimonas pukyongi]|uniref:30S ribosomal protein S2 n=1 Tax=Salaquimonas pukyongi TaxID=2712698 RepID=UPI00096B86B6|nr:30S ribosomal protein S2 [Salaquimonas pukyongi]
MALPEFSLRQLLEAGAHFGHNTHRWNPKMDRYIFGKRNNVHIIDLAQSVPLLHQALKIVSDTVANGGRVLFVGTKRQASDMISESAKKSAQYYVNHRWLGGTLTNWNTISNSIKRLRKLEEMLAGAEAEHLTKKERLMLSREHDKLERALGGIKDMGGTPDLMFVIDTNKEKNAVDEARRLKIPVVAVLDTNCDPDMVDHPIPGNDDASRAIALYCDLIAKAALDGIARQQGSAGVDIGAMAEAPVEEAVAAAPAGEAAAPATEAPAAAAEAPVAEEKPAEEKPAAEEKAAEKAADEKPAKEKAAAEEAPADGGEAAAAPLFSAPEGEGDDLTRIKGIGPVAMGQLNEQGVTTFAQIAALSDDDVKRIDDAMPFSADQISDWRSQAAEIVKG